MQVIRLIFLIIGLFFLMQTKISAQFLFHRHEKKICKRLNSCFEDLTQQKNKRMFGVFKKRFAVRIEGDKKKQDEINSFIFEIDTSSTLKQTIRFCKIYDKYQFCKAFLEYQKGHYKESISILEANSFFQNSEIEIYADNLFKKIALGSYALKRVINNKLTLFDFIIKDCNATIISKRTDTVRVIIPDIKYEILKTNFNQEADISYKISIDKNLKYFNFKLIDTFSTEIGKIIEIIKNTNLKIDSIQILGLYEENKKIENVKLIKQLGQIQQYKCLVDDQLSEFDFPPDDKVKTVKKFLIALLQYFQRDFLYGLSDRISLKINLSKSSKVEFNFYVAPRKK
jgi:hypothetical protein